MKNIAKTKLVQDKRIIDKRINDFFLNEFPKFKYEPLFYKLTKPIAEIMQNGKRLRGSLLLQSYYEAGGTKRQVATEAALAIEIIHAYLLIIDDFSDQSPMRRGSKSAHKYIEENFLAKIDKTDKAHIGESIAVTAGLSAMHLAHILISKLKVDSQISQMIFKELNQAIMITAQGQLRDIWHSVDKPNEISKESILDVMRWKTGYYTFLNPIQLGQLLAGKSLKTANRFKEFAINCGVVFQIQDDIIGLFGQPEQSGKSNLDDLKEGKITLLIKNGLEMADGQQKRELLKVLGNKNITQQDLVRVKKTLVETSALEETVNEAKSLASLAQFQLSQIKIKKDFYNYLAGLTELVLERDK